LLSQEISLLPSSRLVTQLTRENLEILRQEIGYDGSPVDEFIEELSEKGLPSEPSSAALRFLEASRLADNYESTNPQDYIRGVSLSLARELRQARIPSNQCGTYFVPLSELKRLITASVIEREILAVNREMKPANAQMYAKRVEVSAKKLFATLVYLRNGAAICSLLDSELSDQDLPFSMKTVDEHVSLWRREPKQRIQAFEKWDDEEIEKFSHI
jgi:hypothetical protein